jgi:hypothetical protein
MRMRRAHENRVRLSGLAPIFDEAPAAGEEPRILLASDRLTECELAHGCSACHGGSGAEVDRPRGILEGERVIDKAT